jgi:peroxiredoxin family protein/TusA-related sulfurtransferase
VFCQDDGSKCGGVTCSPDLDYSESGDVEEHETADFTGATGEVVKLNACGLQCPGPIMQVSQRVKEMNIGDVLEVRATDPGFVRDIDTWCKRTDNTLLEAGKKDREFVARLVKGAKKPAPVKGAQMAPAKMNKTMVVFSGDLDKAIASLIIANGAASMGRQVTMFYTFWGLNILRRPEKVNVKKSAIQKAFAAMMPRGTQKLGLSRMNFMGMGAKLIRKIMKDHNVDQVETLLQMALDNGVKMIACNMSMDLMGITEEELIDGIELGGVASYLGDAEESDVNLFI